MVQLGLHLRLVGQGLLCKSKARLFSGQLRQIEAHKTVETALLYNIAHQLGKSYYVNFLGGLGYDESQLK